MKIEMVSYSKIIVVDKFSKSLVVDWHTTHHSSVKNGDTEWTYSLLSFSSVHPLGKKRMVMTTITMNDSNSYRKNMLIHILEKMNLQSIISFGA